MKDQDKTMIRQMMTEGTEMLIEFIERMEAIQAAKAKADRKERKAAAKRRAKKAAKKRHPAGGKFTAHLVAVDGFEGLTDEEIITKIATEVKEMEDRIAADPFLSKIMSEETQ